VREVSTGSFGIRVADPKGARLSQQKQGKGDVSIKNHKGKTGGGASLKEEKDPK